MKLRSAVLVGISVAHMAGCGNLEKDTADASITGKDASTAGNDAGDSTEYQLTVTILGGGIGSVVSTEAGINCGEDCTATFPAGTAVILTPKHDESNRFVRWEGACSGSGDCVVAMDSTQTVAAVFGCTGSQRFVYAAADIQTFTPPTCAEILIIEAYGARGTSFFMTDGKTSVGGLGAKVTGTFPKQPITMTIGAHYQDVTIGCGGGGGATFVYGNPNDAAPLIVAGGGGGFGGDCNGAPGSATEVPTGPAQGGTNGQGGIGGRGGAGAGWATNGGDGTGTITGTNATGGHSPRNDGTGGTGGSGGVQGGYGGGGGCDVNPGYFGGGGGGYNGAGGGQGSECGGGGGGGSYNSGANPSSMAGVHADNGQVIVSW